MSSLLRLRHEHGPKTQPDEFPHTLYVHASLALGAVAFAELFPLHVALVPLSAWGLALAVRRMGPSLARRRPPRFLALFLAASGVVTALVWSLLLAGEMASGAFPPATYYTARATYALDLGVIVPACLVCALAVRERAPWGVPSAVPLLAIEALLLPMMAAQTAMQLRAGVAFGPEAAAPFAAFLVLSSGAAWFLWRIQQELHGEGRM